MIRLGDGTEESHNRVSTALADRWMFSGELTSESDVDMRMNEQGLAPALSAMKSHVDSHVAEVLDEATLKVPTGAWMQDGGKDGKHTEHLGYILTELQFLQRAYPGMQW